MTTISIIRERRILAKLMVYLISSKISERKMKKQWLNWSQSKEMCNTYWRILQQALKFIQPKWPSFPPKDDLLEFYRRQDSIMPSWNKPDEICMDKDIDYLVCRVQQMSASGKEPHSPRSRTMATNGNPVNQVTYRFRGSAAQQLEHWIDSSRHTDCQGPWLQTTVTPIDFKGYCERRSIKHIRTPPYHSQSNEQAKRIVDTLESDAKLIFNKKEGENWMVIAAKNALLRITENQPPLNDVRKRGIVCRFSMSITLYECFNNYVKRGWLQGHMKSCHPNLPYEDDKKGKFEKISA
ncbi:hypothetical protein ACTXT7_013726 [Hymenolepis weldensis]